MSAANHTFGNQGGKFSVTVTTNDDIAWTSTVSASANWCTVSPVSGTGTGSFTVTADAYTGESERTVTITVSAPGIDPAILEIIQTATARREFMLSRWANSNLGAKLPATEENVSGPDYKDTWGSYFQWGRNVGFPYSGAKAVIATDENITAENAQEMTEFITCERDWLLNPGTESVWADRAGSVPCPAGYRLPDQMDLRRIYPSSESLGTFSNTQSTITYEKLEDRPGIPDRTLYAYDGTPEAYVMRYEFKGIVGYNGWFKITEIKGNTDTDFQTPEEAAALFAKATESAERCFPICGTLWCENAELANSGTCAYWTQVPSFLFTGAANVIILANNFIGYAPSYRRALGCMIRGIKE